MFVKKTIYCPHPLCNHGKGNILAALQGDSIYVHHRNPEGNYWEHISVRIPGIRLNFSTTAINQSLTDHSPGSISPTFKNDKIFLRCRNAACKRWTVLHVGIPGININFNDAAIIKEDMPLGYHLDLEPASVVVV